MRSQPKYLGVRGGRQNRQKLIKDWNAADSLGHAGVGIA